ncbi:MAG: hypothetical protein J0H85_13500 [Sediminibacterium magnilacihabitans]|jgi:hypothetical protein|nr:hypothetical protein [Sediminibacterium magnilacihabitans]
MASNAVTNGRALYYPHISFTDEAWVKTAALYYRGLSRIVPEAYRPDSDAEIIKRLNDEEEFIQNIDPRWTADSIAMNFVDYAKRELANKKKREQWNRKVGIAMDNQPFFTIHSAKVAAWSKEELRKIGLAKKSRLSMALRNGLNSTP